jgi:hypothetical protein
MTKFYKKQLIEHFSNQPYITREELLSFYKRYESELKETTFRWRIYDLKQKGIIKQVKRGVYAISYKPKYTPLITEKLNKLSKIVSKEYDNINYCIWSTEWLNDFTQHQLGSFITILEVEKDFIESVFENYKEISHLRVHLKPDEFAIERYMEYENTLVIKPLISRSPCLKANLEEKRKDKFKIPSLEKILVDVFCDTKTFYAIQGKELEYIFENAIKHYNINFTKLFSYAKRRGREDTIRAYITTNFSNLIDNLLE